MWNRRASSQSESLSRSIALLVAVTVLVASGTSFAQDNPNVAEFIPSAEHHVVLTDGQPAVTKYELLVYQSAAVDPYLRINLGKPAPQADGVIRADFAGSITVWPLPNTPSEGRVVAYGPNGLGVSIVSNSFVYTCAITLSPATQSFAAAGGTGTLQMTAPSQCGRSATSTADWLAVTGGGSGAGSGTVTYSVAANTATSSRTATLVIGGITHTVTQAGASGGSGGGGGGTSTEARYLSDLSWTSMTNGWGPVERNRSNGESGAADGRSLTVNGVVYAKGLGTHALSDVRYAIPSGCTEFRATAGVDDEVGNNGSVTFAVWGDSTVLYQSPVVLGSGGPVSVVVNISGRSELRLVVGNGGNDINFDHGDWAEARFVCGTTTSTVTYLGEIPWSAMTNGWGPVERNRSNGEAGATDGRAITLNGRAYAKGLGAHARSDVRFALNGACSAFEAHIGVDDEVGTSGSVVFEVWGDGRQLMKSARMTGSTATQPVILSVAGVRELALLVADAGDGPSYDHADWADARVTCSGSGLGGVQ